MRKTDVSPNQYKVNGQTNSTNMHGTHVAALIAGNKDDKGMMGIAYDNASIKAVRWDYQSTIEDPIKYLISDDNVKIINLSMSISATNNDYNANTITNVNDINSGFVNAMRSVMAKNNDIVVVKAAGNEEAYALAMEAVRFFDQGNEALARALEKL